MPRAKIEDHHQNPPPDSGASGRLGWIHGEATSSSGRDGARRGRSKKSTRAPANGKEAERYSKETLDNVPIPTAFLNFPFHERYERLFLAFLAALICLGIRPRIVTEDAGSKARSTKVSDLIRSCDFSLHEMSYIQRDAGKGFRVPRFNMPYELGVAATIAISSKHEFFVFEKVPYRLQASLSDLAVDPHIHGGTAEGVILAVLDVFSSRASRATPDLVNRVFQPLYRKYREIRKSHGWIFRSYSFNTALFLARSILNELENGAGHSG